MALSVTSRTVQVTWNTIECINRNGLITDYDVRLREDDSGDMVTDGVVDFDARTYMASGLRPFTRYIFKVAGVNANGTGVFTVIPINTPEDGIAISCLTGQCLIIITNLTCANCTTATTF